MTLETKYEIGDYVFFMCNNKIENAEVNRIVVSVGTNKEQNYNIYSLYSYKDRHEYELFRTRQDLIDTL